MTNDPWSYDRSHEPPAGIMPERKGFFHQNKLASAPWRWAAGLIDWGFVFFGSATVVIAITRSVDLGYLIGLALAIFNDGYLAARTTQSLGKRICGIRMVWVRVDGTNDSYVCFVPVWVAILRIFIHYPLDYIPLAVGFWLIPILE